MQTNAAPIARSRTLLPLYLTLGALLCLLVNPVVASTSLQLEFTAPSGFNESNRRAVLQWNTDPGKSYIIQSTDDLAATNGWKDVDLASKSSVGPIRWMAPESLSQQKYYRLVLPQPEVFSVEPALVDSSDPGALLSLYGQCLPTNGTVIINGQNFTPTSTDPNGTWITISLNSLPPGTPINGNILVLDSGSNLLTTLPLQTPVLYGTEMTAEQLQGPPDEPPASPQALLAVYLSKKGLSTCLQSEFRAQQSRQGRGTSRRSAARPRSGLLRSG